MNWHLPAADHIAMPWANGQGQTIQMLRRDAPDGSLLFRLSRASVIQDGPFSLFPGIERNLTVISGPGFDLVGARTIRADPLVPVAFPGDVKVASAGVRGRCEDFNVMTARSLPKPDVRVVTEPADLSPHGGLLCVFAIATARCGDVLLGVNDLFVTDNPVQWSGGAMIVVCLWGIAAV